MSASVTAISSQRMVELCAKPRTSKELADELGMSLTATRMRVYGLVQRGLMVNLRAGNRRAEGLYVDAARVPDHETARKLLAEWVAEQDEACDEEGRLLYRRPTPGGELALAWGIGRMAA